ncbi:hypothetical protein CW751_14335 [Brumimicrobium salinarum]|uniref:Glycosyl transferase family 28 C-terminal domain-containing protein n=1 Tax=Brumimicrobium salinarum TaxID=2058658 RepID=A0A2I0QZ35_9FLAO|nr:hypothetical protein CW751_14335 [Brumimicrobium salinarum]
MSPLNWGLGHVCRTIPIIKQLIAQGNEVIICCDENQEVIYRQYFPEIWYVPHQGYPFDFKGKGKWALDILRKMPALHDFLTSEKNKVQDWVEKFNPDLIISDQRYGFISKTVKSVIITHQLSLPTAPWSFLAQVWNRKFLKKFDEIWIPDELDQVYSGNLSNGNFKNKHFIGIQSRFTNNHQSRNGNAKFAYLGIVSGPPPYQQQLFDLLFLKFKGISEKTAIITPSCMLTSNENTGKITFISAPQPAEISNLIHDSEVVVSRCGYTTLMDLTKTRSKAILIPTPKQAEQEYLHSLHENHERWHFATEKDFFQMKL